MPGLAPKPPPPPPEVERVAGLEELALAISAGMHGAGKASGGRSKPKLIWASALARGIVAHIRMSRFRLEAADGRVIALDEIEQLAMAVLLEAGISEARCRRPDEYQRRAIASSTIDRMRSRAWQAFKEPGIRMWTTNDFMA